MTLLRPWNIGRRAPRKGPPRFPTEGRRSMTRSGLACVYCVLLFSLVSCNELCIFLCRLLLFVSTLAKRLAGKTYSHGIFFAEVFPLQRPD